ncbi:MAG: histidine kinase, partial [Spirochaetes bacterium]
MVSVYTEGDECKKCYSCVRSCPTKAIEVHDGKANVIENLCVSCGYCVATCSQGAKRIRSSVNEVLGILRKTDKVPKYAMLAPSFPAAFLDVETGRIVGALREVGFDGVFEVAFGADLVSYKYHNRYKHL